MKIFRALLAAALWAVAALSCGAATPAERELHLSSGGLDRTFLLHEPARTPAGSRNMPLLVVLHGGGGTAEGMVRMTNGRFDELADRDGFFVAYPQGVGKSWNDGRRDIRSKAREQDVDDVGFFRPLVESLASSRPIDRSRIFAAGMSNGAMMSLRLGCSLPGVFRGVAGVAGSLPEEVLELCPARPAAALLLFDGTADPIVPYGGGEVRVLWSRRGRVIGAEKTAELWARRSGCGTVPGKTALAPIVSDGTRVEKLDYPSCAEARLVSLYRVVGGGHTWPGGRPYLSEQVVGKTSGNISACDTIWQTFSGLR